MEMHATCVELLKHKEGALLLRERNTSLGTGVKHGLRLPSEVSQQ